MVREEKKKGNNIHCHHKRSLGLSKDPSQSLPRGFKSNEQLSSLN
jgi:hypothetical protein